MPAAPYMQLADAAACGPISKTPSPWQSSSYVSGSRVPAASSAITWKLTGVPESTVTFGQSLAHLRIAQSIADVPANGEHNDVVSEAAARKRSG